MHQLAIWCLLLLCSPAAALSLRPRAPARRCHAPLMSTMPDGPEEKGEEYTIDWDTAWKKELDSRTDGSSRWRPEGREPIPEDAIRAARVNKAVDDAQFNLQMAAKVHADYEIIIHTHTPQIIIRARPLTLPRGARRIAGLALLAWGARGRLGRHRAYRPPAEQQRDLHDLSTDDPTWRSTVCPLRVGSAGAGTAPPSACVCAELIQSVCVDGRGREVMSPHQPARGAACWS